MVCLFHASETAGLAGHGDELLDHSGCQSSAAKKHQEAISRLTPGLLAHLELPPGQSGWQSWQGTCLQVQASHEWLLESVSFCLGLHGQCHLHCLSCFTHLGAVSSKATTSVSHLGRTPGLGLWVTDYSPKHIQQTTQRFVSGSMSWVRMDQTFSIDGRICLKMKSKDEA